MFRKFWVGAVISVCVAAAVAGTLCYVRHLDHTYFFDIAFVVFCTTLGIYSVLFYGRDRPADNVIAFRRRGRD